MMELGLFDPQTEQCIINILNLKAKFGIILVLKKIHNHDNYLFVISPTFIRILVVKGSFSLR